MDGSLAEDATAPAAWCGAKVFLSKNLGSQNPREAASHRAEQLLTFVKVRQVHAARMPRERILMPILRPHLYQVVLGNQGQHGGFDLAFVQKDVVFALHRFSFGSSESSPELVCCTGQKCTHGILTAQAGDFCSRPDATVIPNCSMACADCITRSFWAFGLMNSPKLFLLKSCSSFQAQTNGLTS